MVSIWAELVTAFVRIIIMTLTGRCLYKCHWAIPGTKQVPGGG